MKWVKLSLVASVCASAMHLHAQEFEYVDVADNVDQIALGYEVPIPVDSLTPIDGFRTYDALNQRHLQLALEYDQATQLLAGETLLGRSIWAYQLSDADAARASGGIEQSALINGGIHAREWQSPEASTGLLENLLQRANRNHVEKYLLDNLNLVIIPVLNIDGYLQTQRYPTTVTLSKTTPRDGRMRRKNLNNTDETLETTDNNQLGVDLNRNNAPYWATSTRSSSNGTSLVYHGTGPASEPEIQALQQGAILAGESQLSFYMDIHSFSQLYYLPQTSSTTRNTQTSFVGSAMRAGTGNSYLLSPSSSGSGIGATDEYFANTYQIPSYTLEIEPARSAAQYGGNGVSHDGFILPNNQVARMREEISRATFAGLYAVSDVPFLESMEIIDENQQRIIYAQWQSNGSGRELVVNQEQVPEPEVEYSVRLQFNKPMRDLNDQGEATAFTGLSSIPGIELYFSATQSGQEQQWNIEAANGAWLTSDTGVIHRYETDVFQVEFSFPSDMQWDNISELRLVAQTDDMVGFALDTDPSSIAQWQDGRWQGYEDINGQETGIGGQDSSMLILQNDDAGSGDGSGGSDPGGSDPDPAPLPTPPAPDSGGGSISYWWILLLARMRLYRKRR